MSAGQVERRARVPGGREDRGDQDVLAAAHGVGVDPGQRQQAGRRRAHALGEQFAVVAQRRRRRVERPEQRERKPGVAARRVDGEVRRRAQPADAGAVLPPLRQALRPQLGLRRGELVGLHALPPRVVFVHPGTEVGGARDSGTSAAGCRDRPSDRPR